MLKHRASWLSLVCPILQNVVQHAAELNLWHDINSGMLRQAIIHGTCFVESLTTLRSLLPIRRMKILT